MRFLPSLLGLLLVSTLSVVHADDDLEVEDDLEVDFGDDLDIDLEDDFVEEWDGTVSPSADIDTVVYFPKNLDNKFTLSQPATILTAFSNVGMKTFNITGMGAHLHSPFDYSYFIQNFSTRAVGDLLRPSSEITLEYTFLPDFLEPVQFWMSVWVDYTDTTGRTYRNTVYNNSITLEDGPTEFSIDMISAYIPLLCMIAGGYFFHNLQNGGEIDVIKRSSAGPAIKATQTKAYTPTTTSRKSKGHRRR